MALLRYGGIRTGSAVMLLLGIRLDSNMKNIQYNVIYCKLSQYMVVYTQCPQNTAGKIYCKDRGFLQSRLWQEWGIFYENY